MHTCMPCPSSLLLDAIMPLLMSPHLNSPHLTTPLLHHYYPPRLPFDCPYLSTCLPSQDAGLGILFWMFALYHIYFPLVQLNEKVSERERHRETQSETRRERQGERDKERDEESERETRRDTSRATWSPTHALSDHNLTLLSIHIPSSTPTPTTHPYHPHPHTHPQHTGISIFTPKVIAIHGVKHALHGFADQLNEDCDGANATAWTAAGLKYDQEAAEGCGKQVRKGGRTGWGGGYTYSYTCSYTHLRPLIALHSAPHPIPPSYFVSPTPCVCFRFPHSSLFPPLLVVSPTHPPTHPQGRDSPFHDTGVSPSMYDAWDWYHLRGQGGNATVGVVGVNEWIEVSGGREGGREEGGEREEGGVV